MEPRVKPPKLLTLSARYFVIFPGTVDGDASAAEEAVGGSEVEVV